VDQDPFEKQDLAKSNPKKVAELMALLEAEQALDNQVMPKDLEGLPH